MDDCIVVFKVQEWGGSGAAVGSVEGREPEPRRETPPMLLCPASDSRRRHLLRRGRHGRERGRARHGAGGLLRIGVVAAAVREGKKRRGNGARAGRRPSRAPTPHPSPSHSGSVEKKTVLENLDLALLAIDEIVDRGLILETDAATVAARASMAGAEGKLPLAEQTLSKVMASAKEQLARSLLK